MKPEIAKIKATSGLHAQWYDSLERSKKKSAEAKRKRELRERRRYAKRYRMEK